MVVTTLVCNTLVTTLLSKMIVTTLVANTAVTALMFIIVVTILVSNTVVTTLVCNTVLTTMCAIWQWLYLCPILILTVLVSFSTWHVKLFNTPFYFVIFLCLCIGFYIFMLGVKEKLSLESNSPDLSYFFSSSYPCQLQS